MKQPSLILLVTLTVLTKEIVSQSSPCPNIFEYKYDDQKYYGIITIPVPGFGRTIMQAKIGIRGPIYDRGSGGLELLKFLDSALEDDKRGRDIQYILKFPQSQQIPTLVRLTLNNRDICRGPDVSNTSIWTFEHEFTYTSDLTKLSHIPFDSPKLDSQINPDPTPNNPLLYTRHTPLITPRTTSPPPSPAMPRNSAQPSDDGSWLNSLPISRTCGRKPKPPNGLQAKLLIIGGNKVDVGEFPWMVALFHYNGRKTVYKCGASLISNTYVITVAHCTENQRKVQLELGKHNINDANEEDYVTRISLNIIQHPEYSRNTAHGDIALILIEPVEFTVKIWPICIWHYGTNLDNVLNKGTLAGWTLPENYRDFSATPMKLEVRTVGLDTCRNSHKLFLNITTQKTFCAGGNYSGSCHWLSGSGFYTIYENVTYLRGIISTLIGNRYECNLSDYAVYPDLAFYLDWLRQYLM